MVVPLTLATGFGPTGSISLSWRHKAPSFTRNAIKVDCDTSTRKASRHPLSHIYLKSDPPAVRLVPCHRRDRQVGDKANAAKGLAPEAKRPDGLQVLVLLKLGGCVAVAQDGQVGLLLKDREGRMTRSLRLFLNFERGTILHVKATHPDAVSIVLDLQQLVAPLLDLDADLSAACI
jgi:hypothetical protein